MKKKLVGCLLFCCVAWVAQSQTSHVKMVTNYGTMEIKLFDNTPWHRDNFLKLVNAHFYDSLSLRNESMGMYVNLGHKQMKLIDGDTNYADIHFPVPAEYSKKNFRCRRGIAQWVDGSPFHAPRHSAYGFDIMQARLLDSLTFLQKQSDLEDYFSKHFKNSPRADRIVHMDSYHTIFGKIIKGYKVVGKINWVMYQNSLFWTKLRTTKSLDDLAAPPETPMIITIIKI